MVGRQIAGQQLGVHTLRARGHDRRVLHLLRPHQRHHLGSVVLPPIRPAQSAPRHPPASDVQALDVVVVHERLHRHRRPGRHGHRGRVELQQDLDHVAATRPQPGLPQVRENGTHQLHLTRPEAHSRHQAGEHVGIAPSLPCRDERLRQQLGDLRVHSNCVAPEFELVGVAIHRPMIEPAQAPRECGAAF